MPLDLNESFEDENVERRAPKAMRKTFDKRRGPSAVRASSHYAAKPVGSGMHRRRRRRYGV